MPLYLIALFAIAAAILLSATTILNSRALTEKLVGRQIISRFIADLFPAMASACRVLGVFFYTYRILLGWHEQRIYLSGLGGALWSAGASSRRGHLYAGPLPKNNIVVTKMGTQFFAGTEAYSADAAFFY